jgi:hypothetical protein
LYWNLFLYFTIFTSRDIFFWYIIIHSG